MNWQLHEPKMTKNMDNDASDTPRVSREKTRATHPCDACALRRVRCEGGRPCSECQKRLLTCTSLRVVRKRGPKGPRHSTTQKVRQFVRALQETSDTTVAPSGAEVAHNGAASLSEDSPESAASCSTAASPDLQRPSPVVLGPNPKYTPLPLEAYCRFLGVFRERLYSVWPVLSCGTLLTSLVSDEHNYEAWALAASTCAAVIAQLRLPGHTQAENADTRASARPKSSSASRARAAPTAEATSHRFAADAEYFQSLYNYREQKPSVSSLLIAFFLHVYCANSELLRTSGFHLRESLTRAHMLCLHRTDSYVGLASEERELRLRVYWVLFVSERTYCIQHGLPTILRPISLRPSPKDGPDGCSGSPILSFLYLTKLFTFLDGDLIEPPSTVSPSNENGAIVGGVIADGSFDSQSARSKVSLSQSDLDSAEEGVGLDETQRVDIFVTRNWIRILLWEYTVRHFRMSCSADNEAFSIFLPALVAHEMLGFFSAVSSNSICAHGYGMELKVFRVADSLLDVLACRRQVGRADGMLLGSRDALHSLERVLSTVGGPQSLFLDKLRRRMGEVQLPVANTSWMQLPWPENRSGNVDEAEENRDAPQSDLELTSGSLFELNEAASQQFLGADMPGTELMNPPIFDYGNTQENTTWNEI